MSVLIKGMEMPDSCFHCKLAEVCQHYKAEHYANKRHEDCPLEEVPSAQPNIPTVDTEDLIVRGDAIEAVNKRIEQIGYDNDPYVLSIRQAVRDVPSAQPEKVDIPTVDTPTVDTPTCEDAVSRQAAIEVIDAVFPVDPMKSEYAQGIACGAALAKTYVEQLPSAQPELIRCKDCEYGAQDDSDCWYCRGLGCQIGDDDGNGFCADGEKRK